MRITWGLKKWLLWLTALPMLILPCMGMLWFVVKFDLPFFHAGDRWLVVVVIGMWWLLATINIFGWKLIKGK